MQHVDTSALQELDRRLAQAAERFPQMRGELHDRMADMAKSALDEAIPVGKTGRLQSWQQSRVGSGGGYAAVSPQKGSLPSNGQGKSYSYGHITNAAESGHAIPQPSGRDSSYRARIRHGRVHGRYFYQKTRSVVEARYLSEVDALEKELITMLEG